MKARLPPYAFWIIAAGFWALAAARLVWLYRNTGGVFGWDFRIYLAAGERAAAGLDPYQSGQIGTGFVNHPALLLLAAPFRFAGGAGFPAWFILSLAGWPLALGLAAGRAPGWRTLALLLPLTAAVEAIFMGQASIPAALCLAGAYACLRRDRGAWAGILVGLGMIFKLSLGIFAAYFVLRRRPRAAVAAGMVFAGLSLAAELAFFRGISGQFLESMAGLYTDFHPGAQNASLVGLPFFPVIAAALLAGLAVRAVREGDGDRERLLIGGFAAWTLLVSPLTWHHHFVLLVVPLVRLMDTGANAFAQAGEVPGPGAPPGRPYGVALAGLIQVDLVGAYLGLPFHTGILAAVILLALALFPLTRSPNSVILSNTVR